MENKDLIELSTSAWREKVYIETSEHVISGYIFMPKIGKKNRLLTEVLNGSNSFLAVKNCSLEYKLNPTRAVEEHDFLQVNISSILLMRPIYE